ncbi:hypothetical protein D9M68_686280 [compost metagenome]
MVIRHLEVNQEMQTLRSVERRSMNAYLLWDFRLSRASAPPFGTQLQYFVHKHDHPVSDLRLRAKSFHELKETRFDEQVVVH